MYDGVMMIIFMVLIKDYHNIVNEDNDNENDGNENNNYDGYVISKNNTDSDKEKILIKSSRK